MSGLSVVIPTRGRPAFLAEAVASVLAGGRAAEVIVVEDGTRLVDEPLLDGARLIRLPHVGRSAARNAGVQAAAMPLVAFLDADDAALPGRLARQLEALEAAPEAALCFGRVEAIDERSHLLPEATALEAERFERLLARGVSFTSLLVDCPIYTSATAVRREAFLAAGGYDPLIDAYEDLDLYLRLGAHGALVPCPGGPVSQHRRHPGNTSSDHLYAGALRLAEKHLPAASGRSRRLLLERTVDCLWGLGDFRAVRRRAFGALAAEPLLAADGRFAKRLLGSLLPTSFLRSRR